MKYWELKTIFLTLFDMTIRAFEINIESVQAQTLYWMIGILFPERIKVPYPYAQVFHLYDMQVARQL
jgi:hypothetical protein